MLTKLLIQDEMTTSLGKTENLFTVDVSGERQAFITRYASLSPKTIAVTSPYCFACRLR